MSFRVDEVYTRGDFSGFVMFPDSPILENSDLRTFTLKGYSDSRPFTHGDNSENIHDEIVNKLFVASTTRNKMRPKKATG